MIVWLASFPKSGNTWVRAMISSLIYSDNGVFNFEIIKKIQQFPNKKHFEKFTDKYQNVQELKKFWVAAQEQINLDKKIKFLKTHHINCKINEYPFTNKNNTLATIYVVRDPRSLVESFSNYYKINKDAAIKSITSKELATGAGFIKNKQNNVFTIIGSWNDHYNSWTKANANLLILRYEDLLIDPLKELNKIIVFLKKFIIFNYNDFKTQNIISSTSFENLEKMEKEIGFFEVADIENNQNKIKFFNKGKQNDWRKYLNENEIEYISSKFNYEMKELGYI
jgi:hypothetical protein